MVSGLFIECCLLGRQEVADISLNLSLLSAVFRQISLVKCLGGFGHILEQRCRCILGQRCGYIWDEGLGTFCGRFCCKTKGLWLRRMTSQHTQKSLGSYKVFAKCPY